jgi:hypothetical protein
MKEIQQLDAAPAADIRRLLSDVEAQLADAREAEAAASIVVDGARARAAFEGRTDETRSALIRAQRKLHDANETRLGLESLLRDLQRGLETASTRESAAAQRKWSAIAASQRAQAAEDTRTVVALLERVAEELETADEELQRRRAEIHVLELEAAGEGASFQVRAARLLSDDHRSFRGLLETLDYLKAVRQLN